MEKPQSLDDVVAELIAIKRLLAFKFLTEGMSQEDVARALGMSQSSVSRMFPDGSGKRARSTVASVEK
ncbi:MAG TPA: helix-turn-helix domain-containing protein [Thermoanaerobaculia bacterium]|nr:helix-turn-helix domain-containing protein [Thermoanaerobaculia bacterium]